jgi:hypothetical protein
MAAEQVIYESSDDLFLDACSPQNSEDEEELWYDAHGSTDLDNAFKSKRDENPEEEGAINLSIVMATVGGQAVLLRLLADVAFPPGSESYEIGDEEGFIHYSLAYF